MYLGIRFILIHSHVGFETPLLPEHARVPALAPFGPLFFRFPATTETRQTLVSSS